MSRFKPRGFTKFGEISLNAFSLTDFSMLKLAHTGCCSQAALIGNWRSVYVNMENCIQLSHEQTFLPS